MKRYLPFIKKNYIEIIIIIFSLIFSSWLMFSTFSYDNGHMLIASKAWSDFASHIPLIRSFSYGANFPPEYPIFPGEPIRYHFLFYAIVGLLEKIGLRIDYALNIPSIIGFSSLILMIYFFAKKLFSSKAVGILSIIFFLFNGSLSFLEFFKIHPLSINTLNDIVTNKSFPSFGPYDGKIVSAFWNLNIYTNQRHLALAYSFSLLLVYLFISPIIKNKNLNYKLSIILGVMLGLSFFFHTAVFLMTILILFFIFLLLPKLRLSSFCILLFSIIIALPQYLYLQSAESEFSIKLNPGYLIAENLTFIAFIKYWFANLGLSMILIPVGYILISKNLKKIFFSFLIIFVVGNLFQFTPDIPTNHKFFNYFIIVGNMLSACVLVFLWKKNILFRPLVCIITLFLIFSGIIDFPPILNDYKMKLDDYPVNQDIKWIMQNTPSNSIFLNSTYLYNPASLAGRKIFMGWPYFSWGAGYNSYKRDEIRKTLLNSSDFNLFCKEASRNNLNYVIINKNNPKADIDLALNNIFFDKYLLKDYENKTTGYIIYYIPKICSRNI